MTVDDKIKDEKLPYNINREATKIALLSGKIRKAFEKQIKAIEEREKNQVEALKVLKPIVKKLTIKDAIPENTLSEEVKNELNKLNKKLKK